MKRMLKAASIATALGAVVLGGQLAFAGPVRDTATENIGFQLAQSQTQPPGGGMGYRMTRQGYGPKMMMRRGTMGTGMGQGYRRPGMGQGDGRPGMGPGRDMRFASVDSDQDGKIIADEAAAWHEQVFATMDEDGDETLALQEYLSVHMGPGRGTGPRAATRQQRKEARFKEIDNSGDNIVTFDEFLAAGAASFKTADRNGDGNVSVWEFRLARRF